MIPFSVLLVLFFVFLLVRIPVAFALLLTSFLYIGFSAQGTVPLEVVPQSMIGASASFILTAIPAFILIGEIMNVSGMSMKLVDLAKSLVGHTKGGVGSVSLMSSSMVSMFSGSAVANAAGTGAVTIPAMIRAGYSRPHASAIEAAGSSLGSVIPPSIAMVVWGGLTGVSIGGLFVAGYIPAILYIVGFILIIRWQAMRSGVPRSSRANWRAIISQLWISGPALVVPVLIIGTILTGFATPTEAAAVGAVATFLIASLLYRGIGIRDVLPLLVRTAKTTATVLFVIVCSGVFAWMLTRERVPESVARGLLDGIANEYVMMVVLVFVLVLIGLFMESLAAMALVSPIVMAVGLAAGIDPLHISLVAVLSLSLGAVTPPVGVVLFVTSRIANTSIERTSRAALPYIGILVLVTILVALFPSLVLFLPNLLFDR